ncbi:MAG: urease accessory UreF family protein [Rudaea sp.]|uniref:urease accessory protein UreF n=1 Tax=Rudaea sp. TaxID=2136325 RepID=UPI0039E2DACF
MRDADTLVDYVDAVLARGGGWIDAVLFARAYEQAHDAAAFDEIADLAAAFRGSAETALESHQQGAAFLAVTRKAWPHPQLDAFAERRGDLPVAHSIAMALACAAHGVPLAAALSAWLHATAANLVSAGVRLIPLGQTDGQIATARLAPRIAVIVADALETSLDELGTAAPLLELCSIRHETQYTRLFRS